MSGKKFSAGQLVIWDANASSWLSTAKLEIKQGVIGDAKGGYLRVATETDEVVYLSRYQLYHDNPEARAFLQAEVAQRAYDRVINDRVATATAAIRDEPSVKAKRKRLYNDYIATMKALRKEDGGGA